MAQEIRTGDLKAVKAAEVQDTAQTSGMLRRAGVCGSSVDSKAIWLGRTTMKASTYSGAHHHGDAESAIYMISGRARFRFGPNLEKTIEVEAGDFIYVPPYTLHQEINLSGDEPVEMVVARASNENIVVNVEVAESVLGPP